MPHSPFPRRARVWLALPLAAGLALPGPVRAAPCPLIGSDRDVLDTQALVSELALHAKTCGTEAQYNAFVGHYGPALSAQAAALDAYFARVDGRAARTDHDSFITALANAQSTAAQGMGSDFCPRDLPLFAETAALENGGELAAYAAGKNLLPADALPECGVAPAPAGRRAATRQGRRR